MVRLPPGLASDPRLIPGVYHHCDQWCSYCGAVDRCVVPRACRLWESQRGEGCLHDPVEAAHFTRELAKAVGETTPDLDALLSADPRDRDRVPSADDPALDLAMEFAVCAEIFLFGSGWRPPSGRHEPPRPRPADVLGYYHLLIGMRISRALSHAQQTRTGIEDRTGDMLGSAKVALVGIDRARAALQQLRGRSNQEAVDRLLWMLGTLQPMVEALFPGARGFVRPGLDAPVV